MKKLLRRNPLKKALWENFSEVMKISHALFFQGLGEKQEKELQKKSIKLPISTKY
jgi:hypothetical protein